MAESHLKQEQILQTGETNVAYPVYVLIGTLLWQGFVDVLGSPLQKLTASRPLLTKLNFPWEAIVLAGLGEALFEFAFTNPNLVWKNGRLVLASPSPAPRPWEEELS